MKIRRWGQLCIGLVIYGVSVAIFIRSDLGVEPWDVFHLGVAYHLHLQVDTVMIVVGAVVLLLWIPLRQLLGIGTVSNVIVLGTVADLALGMIPLAETLILKSTFLTLALVLNALATGLYIGAGFGAGPRDGLMTGICARTGWSVRRVRTVIEVTVLSAGWLLGGSAGIGTLLYAVTIGPLIQFFLPRCRISVSEENHCPRTRCVEILA